MIGKKAPQFKLPATNNTEVDLQKLQGKKVVLYFYPKDSTPGCTTESQQFRDNKASFDKLNTLVFGISRDSIASHEKFKANQELNFELISDADEIACKAYDVIKMKSMYGKQALGIERSSFLIDEQGKLIQQWRKVKADGHAEEILTALKAL